MVYAYLGPEGTFTEAAALRHPGTSGARLVPFPTVPATLAAVRSGECAGAVVPLENSVSGVVLATLGELAEDRGLLRIDAEIELPVTFALMAIPSASLTDIVRVRSHPQAHNQCQHWLAERLPDAEIVPATSTAAAALEVAAAADPREAAIAAPMVAARYGLALLADGIGRRADAVTRFVSVRRAGGQAEPSGWDRSSLVVTTNDSGPGVLAGILGEFARRDVNLSWLQSWPDGPVLGRYHFFLDIDGHIEEPDVAAAVAAVRDRAASVTFLGSYPRARQPLAGRRTAA